jgi:hypothetical protein
MFSWFKNRQKVDVVDDGTPDLDVTRLPNDPPEVPPLLDEQCSWMTDPDDYSELPVMPKGTIVSKSAGDEYLRKQSLRREAVFDIDREIRENKVLYGTETSAEQREVLIQQYARMLQSAEDSASYELSTEMDAKEREQRRHQELLDTVENSTAYGAAKKFAQEHPFVAGFVGAEIVHQLKKK